MANENGTHPAVPATIWNDGEEVPNPNPGVYETRKYLIDYGKPYTSIPADALPALSSDLSPNPTGRGQHTNPPRPDGGLSPSYGPLYQGRVPKPGQKSNWDVHIYYKPNNLGEKDYARALHATIRREFPELKVYRFWEVPIGPHPVPMFETDVFDTVQLGAFLSYLVENRGPLSVLIHPNTGDAAGDHTTRATWLGDKIPLDAETLRALDRRVAANPELFQRNFK